MLLEGIKKMIKDNHFIQGYGVVETSLQLVDGNAYFILIKDGKKYLGAYGKREELLDFESLKTINDNDFVLKVGELSLNNNKALVARFNWLKPVKRDNFKYSFGLGDRLGFASLAHLNLFKDYDVLPVLAQQSIRELMLTGRTFEEVLASASYAAFEAGYTKGFGADGDHLKHEYEIEYAINAGYPMITLDLSEHIVNSIDNILVEYEKLSDETRNVYETRYLNKDFVVGNTTLQFTKEHLMYSVLTYHEAISYADHIYKKYVVPHNLDFEISIDETVNKTTVYDHFFIANELHLLNIKVDTMAPKFHGEFQKGIDYIGELDIFEEEYIIHQAIADMFNFKLSIHSGSDKFSVFPIIGKVSANGLHAKTAGTNWLEALRVVGDVNSELLENIYYFATVNLNKAKQYYHIMTNASDAKPVSDFEKVSDLLNDDHSRQILHITHGLVLSHKVEGVYVYKQLIYQILEENFDLYKQYLNTHIKKHLDLLGLK